MSAGARPTHGADLVVGIDIGGTGTRFVGLDPADGTVRARITRPTPKQGDVREIADFLIEPIRTITDGRSAVAIGIGASGPIDHEGVIRNPDTLPAFTGHRLLDVVSDLTDTAVIDNDAACAAIGERVVGVAGNADRLLHVTLGTGIGVCLLEGNRPWRYLDGSHPEAGHLAVSVPSEPCYCGRARCWEQAASRTTLQRHAAALVGTAPTDPTAIGRLAERADAGDPAAAAVFADHGRALADGLASLITAYGPDLVVIGGSLAAHLDRYRPALDDALRRLDGWVPLPVIRPTGLDDHGGAIGAAHLALSAR